MTAIQIKLPDTLHQKAVEIAKQRDLSIDEIVAASLAQWLSRIVPEPYLEERAERASGKGFSMVMEEIPDIEPEEYDKI